MYGSTVAQSRPPGRPSKRPSKAPPRSQSTKHPAARTTAAPPRRQTMEVQVAWLEPDPSTTASALDRPSQRPIDVETEWLDSSPEPPASNEGALGSPRKRPPRLPGATRPLPPMPFVSMTQRPPPRRHATMEVDMSWLELVEEKTRKTTGDDGASRGAPAASTRTATRSSAPPAAARSPSRQPAPARSSRPPVSDKAGISNARARKPIRREED